MSDRCKGETMKEASPRQHRYGASAPHIGFGTSGRNVHKEDTLWNFWLDGRRGDPDGQVWEIACREAVSKIEACYGSKPTAISPAGDWGTALDVIEADDYNRKQRGERRKRRRSR